MVKFPPMTNLVGGFCIIRISEGVCMKKYKEYILPLAVAAIIYAFFHIIGFGCPIKFFSGISCPGCGMTRALLSALRLDFSSAVKFHPLVFLLPFIPLGVILYECGKIRKKQWSILTAAFCVTFITVWLYRMIFSAGDVVVFSPENGVIPRLFRWMLKYICH